MKQNSTDDTSEFKGAAGDVSTLASIVVVLLLAFALGAYGLDRDSLIGDELNSLSIMGAFDQAHSPADVVALLKQYAPDHQPLYFVLGWAWAQLTGLSQFTMRLHALLIGMLMFAWHYRLATDLAGRRVAVLAALLVSANALVITNLHHIRMYSLVMLFAVIHFWLYWRLVHGPGKGRLTWSLFVASCTAFMYTHNYSLVFFAALGIYHLLFIARSSQWLRVMAAWALGFALFLPGLWLTLAGISFQFEYARNHPLLTHELIAALALDFSNHLAALWLPMVVALGLSLYRCRTGVVARLAFIGLAMFVIMASINAVTQSIDWTRTRYFLMMWPLFVISFSAALYSLPLKRVLLPLFILLWAVSGYRVAYTDVVFQYAFVFYPNKAYPPLHRYVQHLRGKVRADDYVLGFRTSDEIFARWSTVGGTFIDFYLGNRLGIDGAFLHASLKRYRLSEDTRDILSAHPHLLLAHDPSNVPLNYAKTLEVVQEVLMPCDKLADEPALSIRRYAHPVMGCDHEPASIHYENGARLLDRAARYDAAGQRIAALTWWEIPDDEMLDLYNVSLQIITPDWQNLRQVDRHLYRRMVPWSVIELSTAGLPEGEYRLMLILYSRETGERVGATDLSSGESGFMLPLLSFNIRAK